MEDAPAIWGRGHEYPPPPSPADRRWKVWNLPQMQELYDNFLIKAVDSRSYARLLAVATKESGAWLNALPVSALGLRMDDDDIKIAVGLRLGVPLCGPHMGAFIAEVRPMSRSTRTVKN